MNNYSVIHIFYANGDVFIKPFIKEVEDINKEYKLRQLFIVTDRNVYEELSQNYSILYEEKPIYEIINKYSPTAEYVVVHNIGSPRNGLKINKKYLSKVIWRTWGHDVLIEYQKQQPLKNIIRFFTNCRWIKTVRKFRGVGIANIVDKINISNIFGDVNTFLLGYAFDEDFNLTCENHVKAADTLNVMIGHSATRKDNHIKVVKLLERFCNEDITLYFFVSYGEKDYISEIKKYVKTTFGSKAIFVENYMNKDEYWKVINRMDVAIIDCDNSNALGTVGLLLKARKKIFLCEKGIIAKGFRHDNIPYFSTESIMNMPFDEFKKEIVYDNINLNNSTLTNNIDIERKYLRIFFDNLSNG